MFKEDRKIKNLVEQFKINKSTIMLKINIAKLVDKHPNMLTSKTRTLKTFARKTTSWLAECSFYFYRLFKT